MKEHDDIEDLCGSRFHKRDPGLPPNNFWFLCTSSVFGTAVNTDRIVISDDGFEALDAALANELASSAVSVQLLALKHYR